MAGRAAARWMGSTAAPADDPAPVGSCQRILRSAFLAPPSPQLHIAPPAARIGRPVRDPSASSGASPALRDSRFAQTRSRRKAFFCLSFGEPSSPLSDGSVPERHGRMERSGPVTCGDPSAPSVEPEDSRGVTDTWHLFLTTYRLSVYGPVSIKKRRGTWTKPLPTDRRRHGGSARYDGLGRFRRGWKFVRAVRVVLSRSCLVVRKWRLLFQPYGVPLLPWQ